MTRKIQHKRGLEANLPQLDVAEIAFTTDSKKPFIGSADGNVEIAKKADVDEKADKTYVDTELGKKASTDEVSAVSAQLADTASVVSTKITNINEKASAETLITFIDDDGQNEVYTRLFPIFSSKQVPFGGAIITSYAGNNAGFMNLQQIQECRKKGMEVLSHTVNHYNLAVDLTPEQIDYELRESKEWLKQQGLENEAFVYPQSGQNLAIRKNTRVYYDYAFGEYGFNDEGFLNHSLIKRIAFGSWTDGNPAVNGNSEKNTLAYYKACVDHAVSTNSWLVFMSHVKQQPLEQDTILGELIDYIKSLGVRIVKPSEGFRLKANKLAVGDTEEKYLYVGESNISTNITAFKRENLNGRANSSPITDYEKGYVTVTDVTNTDNASFPDGAGTLETYRTNYNWEGYSYQIYRPLGNNKTYRRLWGSNAWNSWVWVEGDNSPIKVLPANSVTAATPDSEFAGNKISYCIIQTSGASGFPKNSAGTLIVDKLITVNGYRRHRYLRYDSKEIYERVVKPDGTYGEWVLLNPQNSVLLNVPEAVVPANSTLDVSVDLSGLNANTTQIWGNPAWGLPTGVMYNVSVMAHNKVNIRFANLTANAITVTARNWAFTYVI